MTESEIRAFFEAEQAIAALLLRKYDTFMKSYEISKQNGNKESADTAAEILSMLDMISNDLSDIDYMFGEIVKKAEKKESEGAA